MPPPQKRILGRTRIAVSELGFGAWPIGGAQYGPVPEGEAIETVKAYIQAGGNFIDTARAYGQSETILGKVLSQDRLRDQTVLASKTFKGDSLESIPSIRADLEESLRLLRTDYLDLYYLHMPPDDPGIMDRTLDEFEILKKEGKIRAIGASIKGPAVTAATVKLCRQYIDSGRVDAIQLVYSILRQKNAEIFGYAFEKGVGLVVRTSMESGFLGGKYRPGEVIAEGHRKRWAPDTQRLIFEKALEMEKYAVRPPYTSMAEVAVRFALELREVSSVIVGARTPDQSRQNVALAAKPPLDAAIIKRLKDEFGRLTERFNPT